VRCTWEAVDHIVDRVVVEHTDDTRLDGLLRIGVDEVSYKRGHRYLTIVADHDSGRVVWVGKDRTKPAFEAFFDALGPPRAEAVQAISMDGSSIYLPVARDRIPPATVCLDPFHVMKWTNEVLDSVYRAEAPRIPLGKGLPNRREWRRTRYALRAGRERLDNDHRDIVNALRRHWSGVSANTSTPSSPRSSSACPTPGWKASTPASGSSNAAASASATSTHSTR
jgi:transposase